MLGTSYPKRKQRDRDVMEATFHAIASAMGWDKECPITALEHSVRARMAKINTMAILEFDEVLAGKLRETNWVEQELRE